MVSKHPLDGEAMPANELTLPASRLSKIALTAIQRGATTVLSTTGVELVLKVRRFSGSQTIGVLEARRTLTWDQIAYTNSIETMVSFEVNKMRQEIANVR